MEPIDECLEQEENNSAKENTSYAEPTESLNITETLDAVSTEELKRRLVLKEYAAIDAIRKTAEIMTLIAEEKAKILMKNQRGQKNNPR